MTLLNHFLVKRKRIHVIQNLEKKKIIWFKTLKKRTTSGKVSDMNTLVYSLNEWMNEWMNETFILLSCTTFINENNETEIIFNYTFTFTFICYGLFNMRSSFTCHITIKIGQLWILQSKMQNIIIKVTIKLWEYNENADNYSLTVNIEIKLLLSNLSKCFLLNIKLKILCSVIQIGLAIQKGWKGPL